MKRYLFLTIFVALCIPFFCLAKMNPYIAGISGVSDSGCVKDTVTLVMDESSMSDDGTQSMEADAYGQSISYGSSWSLYSIEIEFNNNSNCVASVRIGPGSDLSSVYYEEWASVSISDGNVQHEFVSIDNDSYTGSTTYYVGFLEVSGTCGVLYDNTTPPYGNGSSFYIGNSGWNTGSADTGRDYQINVFKCQ